MQVARRVEREERVVGHFPEVPVRIGEVTGLAAPMGLARQLDGLRPSRDRVGVDPVHLVLAAHVMGERDARKAARTVLDLGVLGQGRAAEQGQREAVRLEEYDARLARRRGPPAERLVERPREREVVDAERDEADARLHRTLLPVGSTDDGTGGTRTPSRAARLYGA